jgi:tetraacyldisaccharide 4'-kinase
MNASRERWALRVLSGEDGCISARILRSGLSLAEPFYAGAMNARNALFSREIRKIHRLPRPTISVGNITTGGTGKTPMVRWLAKQLIERGIRPPIMLRGYRGRAGQSDDQRMHAHWLGYRATVVADPDRVAGAVTAMAAMPQPDVFILDDAFQHRRVARGFDLVLINATDPFGFDHVLPRGLLREPLRGLARAGAVVLTRSDQVAPEMIDRLRQRIGRYTSAPVYCARHVQTNLRSGREELPIDQLRLRRFFAFAGIAHPSSLDQQFADFGPTYAGHFWFGDHHDYDQRDLTDLQQSATSAGAEMLVTTEKDWAKLRDLPGAKLPIYRVELRIGFADGDENRLLSQIIAAINPTSASSPPAGN